MENDRIEKSYGRLNKIINGRNSKRRVIRMVKVIIIKRN